MESSRDCVSQGKTAGEAEGLLKVQTTKFHFQLLNLDAGKGRTQWTREVLGDYGVVGLGERTEGPTGKIHVLGHLPNCKSHLGRLFLSQWHQPKGDEQ